MMRSTLSTGDQRLAEDQQVDQDAGGADDADQEAGEDEGPMARTGIFDGADGFCTTLTLTTLPFRGLRSSAPLVAGAIGVNDSSRVRQAARRPRSISSVLQQLRSQGG